MAPKPARKPAACTVIAMQDGGTGAGAQHGGAGREANLIFVLPPNVYVGPPVGGTFWFQISIQAPSLKIWVKLFFGVREVARAERGWPVCREFITLLGGAAAGPLAGGAQQARVGLIRTTSPDD